ncbi:MAG: hypothetical protein HPY30_00910 [Gammaproteobacteria bacterium (ex Lamellibrachia satsuma)]|nr:MAG: hypothetical protein HPY30_00910 [Gammaproteobacteria bacterium (ex Lamellibrachia satsuma)]
MAKKSVFGGFPSTRKSSNDHGDPIIAIMARCPTPRRTKAADILSLTTTISVAAGALVYLQNQPGAIGAEEATLVAGSLLTYPLFKSGWRFLLKKKIRITLDLTTFSFKTWRGWKHFDRTLPHGYALLPHDKTKAEARHNEFRTRLAQAEGEVIQPPEYFGEAVHLCFIHAGQRIDITAIYGKKMALALQSRLQLCDGVLDAHAGINGGTHLSPQQSSTPQPGDLPDD